MKEEKLKQVFIDWNVAREKKETKFVDAEEIYKYYASPDFYPYTNYWIGSSAMSGEVGFDDKSKKVIKSGYRG